MIFNLNQLLLLAAVVVPDTTTEAVWVERQTYLMGTVLRAEVGATDRETAVRALEAAFGEIRRLEQMLSSWDATSEIGRVNAAAAGRAVSITAELATIVTEARGWHARTAGAFDPGIGALVDAWDLRGEGRRPSEGELEVALGRSGLEHFSLSEAPVSMEKERAGAWLDTGGFGKGLALRSAGRLLREMGIEGAILDLGGQALVIGDRGSVGSGWRIDVADPTSRERSLGTLKVADRSVATSGQSERFVEVEGSRVGHILDPRTGRPVPAWGSVTVVAEDALEADILSTALYVMGPEEGAEWAAGLDGIGVLFLADGEGGPIASWNGAFSKFDFHSDTAREPELNDR